MDLRNEMPAAIYARGYAPDLQGLPGTPKRTYWVTAIEPFRCSIT